MSILGEMPVKTRTRRSLAVSDGFRSFVLDQLSELEDVMPRSMFGGVGLYSRGLFFGILARDRFYLKVDDENRAAYEEAGEKPFKPYPGRPGTMQYYAVPLAILESATELVQWARDARSAAARAASRVRRARKRP
jgi:DNA transformation protein and related proteins